MKDIVTIAIFSDVHANLPALECVLEDIDRRSNISACYCLGDLVDFAPWGNEVITRLRNLHIPCLLGNHDERIALNHPVLPLPHHDVAETAQRNMAIAFSKATITPANKAWLAQLPYQLSLVYKIKNTYRKVLLVHASTRSNDEYIYENHDEKDLESMLAGSGADAIMMGHTHLPYSRTMGDNGAKLLVNCGSVGRSREADRPAAYTILHIGEDRLEAEIVRIAYPVEKVARAIYESGIPDFYGDFLLKQTGK